MGAVVNQIFSSYYPIRKLALPTNATLNLAYPLSDAIINELYNRFGCCLANINYKATQKAKEGIDSNVCSNAKLLEIAMYVLRNWYNPITVAPIFRWAAQDSNTISGYLVTSGSDNSVTYPIFTNVVIGGSFTYAQIVTAINAVITPGWTASYVSDNFINITPSFKLVNGYTWARVDETQSPAHNWYNMGANLFNPCITQAQVTTIIQNCLNICGCNNCNNIAALEADNNYVSIGQTFNKPSGTVLLNSQPFLT